MSTGKLSSIHFLQTVGKLFDDDTLFQLAALWPA